MYCIGLYQYLTKTRTKELFRLSSTILDQPQYRSSPYSLTQSTQTAQPRSVRINLLISVIYKELIHLIWCLPPCFFSMLFHQRPLLLKSK